jgi:hypothetical protein
MKVTPSDFGGWRSDPITKFVFDKVEEIADEALQTLFGYCRHAQKTDDIIRIAWNHGYIEGLTQVMKLTWDDIATEEEEDAET